MTSLAASHHLCVCALAIFHIFICSFNKTTYACHTWLKSWIFCRFPYSTYWSADEQKVDHCSSSSPLPIIVIDCFWPHFWEHVQFNLNVCLPVSGLVSSDVTFRQGFCITPVCRPASHTAASYLLVSCILWSNVNSSFPEYCALILDPFFHRVIVFMRNLNHPYSMWMGKFDQQSQKDLLFNELHQECKLCVPGRQLSPNLRHRLERLSQKERPDLVNQVKEGSSPLFLACKKGNVDVVKYLIETCIADSELRGMGFYENE